MTEPVIQLADLVKNYGSVRALDGLTMEIPPGPVGLLGPNGAGKTTLIKLLLGLLTPSSGSARISQYDPRRSSDRLRLRCEVGYMPEGDCLLPRRSAVGVVSTLGRMTGLSWEDAMTRSHEVLDYVGLEEARYRELTEYSTGMKQRLKLAQALVHDPPILLLDEPTNGLDPKGRRHMLELVDDLGHNQGKNVLLCSHLLPDVEKTCDHVVVLARGRARAHGAIAELTRGDGYAVRVQVRDPEDKFPAALKQTGWRSEKESGGQYRIVLDADTETRPGEAPAVSADEVFSVAHTAGVIVEEIEVVRSSLEEVFLQLLQEADAEVAS